MHIDVFEEQLKILDRHSPSFMNNAMREDAFLRIGEFFESSIRNGQLYDLKQNPNAVWELIQSRLLRALDDMDNTTLGPHEIMLWQMYNSGVLIQQGDTVFGLDVIPMLRSYGWTEPEGLTQRLADKLDFLLITHHHPDHYDRALIQACLEREKPVAIPEHLTGDWPAHPTLHAIGGGWQATWKEIQITGRNAYHVWRDTMTDVPVVYYELTFPGDYTILFSGDADYTKAFEKTPDHPVHLLFLPWRNPNAAFEDGHELQTHRTIDAVCMVCEKIQPAQILFEHYGELEHVHDGFPASYDMAVSIRQSLQTPSDWLFWGESILLKP